MNYRECLEINAAFASKNLALFVAYYRRSLPRFKQVKSWLEQNLIGDVLHLQWTLRKPHSEVDLNRQKNWRTLAAFAGGGYFVDLASHGLNLFAWLLGDIVQASGVKTNQHGLYKVEDAVVGTWLFSNGATGSGSWHFGTLDSFEEVQIRGTKGQIIFSVFEEKPLQLITDEETTTRNIKNPENIQYVHIQNMIRHVHGEIVHPSLGDSAARTNWVMDKILGNL
jgi:predicted dehydrogenase